MKFGVRELLFLVLMIGTAAASFFVLKRSLTKKQTLETQTLGWKKQLADLSQSAPTGLDWEKKMDELKKAISFFESKLPAEKDIDVILTTVENKVKDNALEKRTVKPGRIEKTANYNELPIEMTLSGDFKGFYAFLQQLEKMDRITRVTSMNLAKITDKDGAMQAKITLSIFFEPDDAAPRSANVN